MVYQRALSLSLSLYLADAGVSPELEALKRGFMRGESPELGPLKREGRACARAAREREALAKRSSARTQALKPSLARSLARSLAGEARETGEREMERHSRCTRTHAGVSRSQLPEALLRGRPRQRPHRDERNGSRQLPAFKPRRVWLVP